ncbi:YdeI/OmpD-associated family protein [Dinghuibacter silviterrae]|uniref:Uncharacterized protein YdeI (YjbR/CyaY-like superfamily) n=1 Tax=Dinghuibacter silviterrae TaxID=1539049 RepID=A0A4R8DF76_9BACT|nr:YdeI/OmpD-associated family protein [Dinghuibacter silviterrae]TDW95948.1 uncharacterized protein YdeI (YjbR/CyaY-like superfamily) [Dinghuibacter silviterrae]
MNPKVDAYLDRATQWQKEMAALRTIVLDCGLTEELKWGKPCYAYQGKNIVVIQGFKEYCALLFLKGYALSDTHGILQKTGENTVVGRQIRVNSVREIAAIKDVLKTYIYQAVEVEEADVKAPVTKEPNIPEEFQHKLDKTPALKKAFSALTPGRQRAYVFYFSQPKQAKTRESRVEKCVQQILHGKGLNED